MTKITTIPQLLEHLAECNSEELKSVYKLLDIPKHEFEPYMHWSNQAYTRNCIIRTDDYELLLLCWEKDQASPIHSHNNQECWVYNAMGKFEEIRFTQDQKGELQQVNDFKLNEQNFSYMNDQIGFHILKNSYNGRSASLHLYAKPIDECLVYNEDNHQFELTRLLYHSISGKLSVTI